MSQSHFIIINHKLTDEIKTGFLPHIVKKNLIPVIVTDEQETHQALLKQFPSLILIKANLFEPVKIIDALDNYQIKPGAIFCNSNLLQTTTAIVAEFFDLPRKSWHSAYYAKNKFLMRQALLNNNLSQLWSYRVHSIQEILMLTPKLQYPIMVKPVKGVSSLCRSIIYDEQQLLEFAQCFWKDSQNPELHTLVVEKYLKGVTYSLETISYGGDIKILGAFKFSTNGASNLTEQRAIWLTQLPQDIEKHLLKQLKALDINFGTCHSKFIIDPQTNLPEIIEINYHCPRKGKVFMMDHFYANQYFKTIIDIYLHSKPMTMLQRESQPIAIEFMIPEHSGKIISQHTPLQKHVPYL